MPPIIAVLLISLLAIYSLVRALDLWNQYGPVREPRRRPGDFSDLQLLVVVVVAIFLGIGIIYHVF